MLSVLVWLAMWGQGQQIGDFSGQWTTDAPKYEVAKPTCEEGGWISIRRDDDTMDKIAVCHDNLWHRYTPPAEHVIEIKTVREDHGTAKDKRTLGLGGSPYCDKPDDSLEYTDQCKENICTSMYIAPHCVKLTRELWIDGVRWGVVKGLD